MRAHRPFPARAVPLLGLCLLVSACINQRGAGRGTMETPPQSAPVKLTQPPLTPVRTLTYTDRWQREVYTLYADASGARAELIYAEATATDTALEYPRYGLHHLTKSWNLNRNGLTRWGPVHHLRSGTRVTFYAPFRPAGVNRQCVSFGSDWELTADDPRQRPGKALFGYFCAAPGRPLDTGEIEKVLTGIRVPATAAANSANANATPASGPGAIGNAHFPFAFARHYNVSDGSSLP